MVRPRSYDDDALLDAAIEQFWVSGYRGSSVSDLARASGVANGSLYQAYGSKWELFLAAYRRYCDRRVAFVDAVLGGPHGDLECALNAYFDAILADCAAYPDRRGCLMLNAMAELGDSSEVATIAQKAVGGMEAAVTRAMVGTGGRVADDTSTAATAASVVAISQSMIHLSRIGRDADELQRMGRQAAHALAS
jgi:TetR/AcrR family transcriptional repressor of nem operon